MIVLFVSLLAGVLLAEVSMRFFGVAWFISQLKQLGAFWTVFHKTTGDDERQALLLMAGRRTLQFSLTVLLLLTVLAMIALAAPWLFVWTESDQRVYLVDVSIVATVWWLSRRKRRRPLSLDSRNHAYGVLERWLHWIALETESVRHLSFDLERQFVLPVRRDRSIGDGAETVGSVYICGLARSGTMMLLHLLDDIDDFRSLTYRDMPFVLAPNLWRLFTRYMPRPSVAEERAHGDGIHVHFDSPEGFEEVFWRTYNPRAENSRCFAVEVPTREALDAFADYRSIVVNPRIQPGPMRRYLSKNNNNLLRLRSIASDPGATVLLVYRNPIATARSLHRLHLHFCALQRGDRFARQYMGWLAHHEFGLDHLPFCFAMPYMDSSLVPDDVNYWLDYWCAVYSHVLAQEDLHFNLVSHDVLCANPSKMLEALFDVLGVEVDIGRFAQRIAAARTDVDEGFSPALLQRAERIYRELRDSPKNICQLDAL